MNPLIIKGDYQMAWSAVKEYFEARLDGDCQVCLERPKNGKLHVHHRNGNALDNRIENLIGVCPSCHRKLHGGKTEKEVYLES